MENRPLVKDGRFFLDKNVLTPEKRPLTVRGTFACVSLFCFLYGHRAPWKKTRLSCGKLIFNFVVPLPREDGLLLLYLNGRKPPAGPSPGDPGADGVHQPPQHLPTPAPVVVLVDIPVGLVAEAKPLRPVAGKQQRSLRAPEGDTRSGERGGVALLAPTFDG